MKSFRTFNEIVQNVQYDYERSTLHYRKSMGNNSKTKPTVKIPLERKFKKVAFQKWRKSLTEIFEPE
jgi:hypothetical protein